MFGQHVTKELSAYFHGELSAGEARRVTEHLLGCQRCRKDFEEVKLGVRLAECLPPRAAPADLWQGIEASLARAQDRGRTARAPGPWPRLLGALNNAGRPRRAAVGFAAAALLAIGVMTVLYMRAGRSSWEVARLQGAPTIDSDRIGEKGRLTVGDWLETDASSRALIDVADIGEVEIDPETRVRLVETRHTEHRLELARGRLHARIWAPPRLFFVNTPSAVAADLGCAYTLEVDDRGRSFLHVSSGWVALETEDRESIVPAGAVCATVPERGPGTPFFEDAPESFVGALARLDFEDGGRGALEAVLAESRPRDTLTLWHLLARAAGEERALVYERLAALSPPPPGVTREGVLQLDRPMLDLWKVHLEEAWLSESVPDGRRAWREVWK